MLFYGDNPLADPVVAKSYWKWKTFFDVFLLIRDARYGNLLHLPFDVSAFDQPAKTTAVITIIQELYVQKIIEDTDKAFKK